MDEDEGEAASGMDNMEAALDGDVEGDLAVGTNSMALEVFLVFSAPRTKQFERIQSIGKLLTVS